jgi:hypothetical protein
MPQTAANKWDTAMSVRQKTITIPCSGPAQQAALWTCPLLESFLHKPMASTLPNGQVGNGSGHALLWTGTAASVVDLNPSGFDSSQAYGVGGGQQVGEGIPSGGGAFHALLWSGTAASAVDLNPSGFYSSDAKATNGQLEVGTGQASSTSDGIAMLWSGTAASAVNLQTLLPASNTWTDSEADSIDAQGNIFGIATGMVDGNAEPFAVEWSPVPEPSTFALAVLAFGLLVLLGMPKSSKSGPRCLSH